MVRISGDWRLVTTWAASAANLLAVSVAARFSTLKAAAESWLSPAAAETSWASPPETRAGMEMTCSLKLEKL